MESDSPAERAGFKVGGYIISDDGIDVKDSKALARRSRPKIGETRIYVLEFAGETVSIDLTFSNQPKKEISLSSARALIGFFFLIFGLWAYFKVKNKSTTLLALVGFSFGFNFIHHPYFVSYTLRTIYQSIGYIIVMFGLAFLLHFMMVFPKAKAMMAKKNIRIMLYSPAVLTILFFLFRIIFQPKATSTLNIFTNILIGLFVVGYLSMAAVAIVYSYIKATSEERATHGLNIMLFGTIIGLSPTVITTLIHKIIAPKLALPGVEFYFLTFVLIPVSLALASIKSGAITAKATT